MIQFIPLILPLLKNYWKPVVGLVLVGSLAYTGYYKVKDIGYKEANKECAERMQEYNDKLDKLIVAVQDSSAALISESLASRASVKKDVSAILASIKNKPLYTIEAGKCTPNDTFIDSFNQLVDRVNNK